MYEHLDVFEDIVVRHIFLHVPLTMEDDVLEAHLKKFKRQKLHNFVILGGMETVERVLAVGSREHLAWPAGLGGREYTWWAATPETEPQLGLHDGINFNLILVHPAGPPDPSLLARRQEQFNIPARPPGPRSAFYFDLVVRAGRAVPGLAGTNTSSGQCGEAGQTGPDLAGALQATSNTDSWGELVLGGGRPGHQQLLYHVHSINISAGAQTGKMELGTWEVTEAAWDLVEKRIIDPEENTMIDTTKAVWAAGMGAELERLNPAIIYRVVTVIQRPWIYYNDTTHQWYGFCIEASLKQFSSLRLETRLPRIAKACFLKKC